MVRSKGIGWAMILFVGIMCGHALAGTSINHEYVSEVYGFRLEYPDSVSEIKEEVLLRPGADGTSSRARMLEFSSGAGDVRPRLFAITISENPDHLDLMRLAQREMKLIYPIPPGPVVRYDSVTFTYSAAIRVGVWEPTDDSSCGPSHTFFVLECSGRVFRIEGLTAGIINNMLSSFVMWPCGGPKR